MNMKKKITSAVLTIVLCLSLIAGSTYALFTSEDKIEIAVSSATVQVDAKINNLKGSSMDVELTAIDNKITFVNGGEAVFDKNGDLSLTNITPGDKVTFDIELSQLDTNVAVQYRLLWTVDNDFGDVLVATADDAKIENGRTAWKPWTEETDTKLSVSIELPADAGNDYQENEATISFKIQVAQGNADMPDGLTTAADNAALWDASVNGGDISLIADITLTGEDPKFSANRAYAVKSGVELILDLNGHELNYVASYQNGSNTGYTYLYTTAYNGKLEINGEGTISAENSDGFTCIVYAQGPSEVVVNGGDFRVTDGVAMWAGNNSKVTINGGSFISTGVDQELIYSSGGVIDIYDGFFHNTEWENRPVNVANANRGTGFINIYGGTFVNFDPSTGGDDPNNIKVADGYKVVSETQENGDVWYTVVPE